MCQMKTKRNSSDAASRSAKMRNTNRKNRRKEEKNGIKKETRVSAWPSLRLIYGSASCSLLRNIHLINGIALCIWICIMERRSAVRSFVRTEYIDKDYSMKSIHFGKSHTAATTAMKQKSNMKLCAWCIACRCCVFAVRWAKVRPERLYLSNVCLLV